MGGHAGIEAGAERSSAPFTGVTENPSRFGQRIRAEASVQEMCGLSGLRNHAGFNMFSYSGLSFNSDSVSYSGHISFMTGYATAIGLTACGGSGQNSGTTEGSYRVTVTASSGKDTASATVPLTVQ